MVRLAGAFAASSGRIKTTTVGTHQFPDLKQKYGVSVVPRTWVNDRVRLDGAAPTWQMMEATYVLMIKQALDESIPAGRFIMPDEKDD